MKESPAEEVYPWKWRGGNLSHMFRQSARSERGRHAPHDPEGANEVPAARTSWQDVGRFLMAPRFPARPPPPRRRSAFLLLGDLV